MAKIAILYCKKVKDHSCIGCAKCFKGVKEKNNEFAKYDDIEIVAMTDCGDCPGLVIPRLKLVTDVVKGLGGAVDAVHLGTCVKLAIETAACPIKFEELKERVNNKFNLPLVLGTHAY